MDSSENQVNKFQRWCNCHSLACVRILIVSLAGSPVLYLVIKANKTEGYPELLAPMFGMIILILLPAAITNLRRERRRSSSSSQVNFFNS